MKLWLSTTHGSQTVIAKNLDVIGDRVDLPRMVIRQATGNLNVVALCDSPRKVGVNGEAAGVRLKEVLPYLQGFGSRWYLGRKRAKAEVARATKYSDL